MEHDDRPYAAAPTLDLLVLKRLLGNDHSVWAQASGVAERVAAELDLRDDRHIAIAELRARTKAAFERSRQAGQSGADEVGE
ncbi:hypothetical protein ACOZ38_25335 [Sphaerisporangium viridialbum]|uniref:hypothetical protein n=1 Tax=Sphaerisporangium viridialbum TaxID=46189 RepID=UPI003C780D8B